MIYSRRKMLFVVTTFYAISILLLLNALYSFTKLYFVAFDPSTKASLMYHPLLYITSFLLSLAILFFIMDKFSNYDDAWSYEVVWENETVKEIIPRGKRVIYGKERPNNIIGNLNTPSHRKSVNFRVLAKSSSNTEYPLLFTLEYSRLSEPTGDCLLNYLREYGKDGLRYINDPQDDLGIIKDTKIKIQEEISKYEDSELTSKLFLSQTIQVVSENVKEKWNLEYVKIYV